MAIVNDLRGCLFVRRTQFSVVFLNVTITSPGKYVGAYGKQSLKKGVPGGLNLVHDLAISHLNRMVYVADRENGQVVYKTMLFTHQVIILFKV